MKTTRISMLLLCLFIIALASVTGIYAAATQVFSGWVYSRDSVNVNDEVIEIEVPSSLDKAFADFGTNELVIINGTCESLTITKICVDNVMLDTDELNRKAQLTIYELTPTLTVTRTISSSEIDVNQIATITVSITNSGGGAATNFSYVDEFPDEIEMYDADGISIVDNSVVWTGYINPSGEISFTYDLKAVGEIDRSFKARMTYFDGVEDQEEFTSALSLEANPVITLKVETADDSIYLGEDTNLTINFTNKDAGSIDVDYFNINIPEQFEIISEPVTSIEKLDGNNYRWSGTLIKNTSKIFYFKVKALRTGDFSFSSIVSYTDPDGAQKTTPMKKKDLDVKIDDTRDLHIRTTKWVNDNTALESEQEKYIDVWLQNKNIGVDFVDLVVNVSSGLFNLTPQTMARLNRTKQKKFLRIPVTGPNLTSSASYSLKVNVNYKTQYGDSFSESLSKTITVNPVKGLVITQSASATSVEGGEEIEFTVSIYNKRSVDVKDVEIVDRSSDNLTKLGSTFITTDINKEDTKTLYEYKILTPRVASTTEYYVNTTAAYTVNRTKYIYSAKTTITVKPRQIKLTFTRTLGSLFKGAIATISYALTNPESETVDDIVMIFPLQQEVDIIGGLNHTIKKLDPGESITVTTVGTMRPKFNKTMKIDPALVTYRDKYGNKWSVNSTSSSKTVSKGFISGPAIIVTKNLSRDSITLGENTTVLLAAENIGSSETSVNLKDQGNEWNLIIKPGAIESVNYEYTPQENGTIALPQATATYSYLNQVYTTGSNIISLQANQTKKVEETGPVQPEEGQLNVTEAAQINQTYGKRTFFVSIWERIKSFISNVKERIMIKEVNETSAGGNESGAV